MSVDASDAVVVVAPTRLESLAGAVSQALAGQLLPAANALGELTYEVGAPDLKTAAVTLRDTPGLQFEMCMDVCGVDYLEHGRAEWKTQDATSSGFSRGVARGHRRCGERVRCKRGCDGQHVLSGRRCARGPA